MSDNEFGVFKLTEAFKLLPELAISRKIFCHPDDLNFFSSILLPGSDIQVVIDDRINSRTVILSKDCELKCLSCKIGWLNDDFINDTLTVIQKYIID